MHAPHSFTPTGLRKSPHLLHTFMITYMENEYQLSCEIGMISCDKMVYHRVGERGQPMHAPHSFTPTGLHKSPHLLHTFMIRYMENEYQVWCEIGMISCDKMV